MDPNVTLAELRRLAALAVERRADRNDADALGEHVQALDGWLTGGGFLPQAWADQQIITRAIERGRLDPQHEQGARDAARRLL